MKNTRVRTYSAHIASVIICALLVLVSLPSPARTALADLPPRFTPTPTPPAQPAPQSALAGAQIQLRAQFSQDWPAAGIPWQELWTVVQWQDEWGYWHNVEGWQSTLDEVQDCVGTKTWWLDQGLLGKGPFRWRVYRSQGATLLATSSTFNLPARTGETTTIELALGP